MPRSDTEKAMIESIQIEMVALTTEFCRRHLDDEYRTLCEELIAKMARKRVVPFLSGKPSVWAGAVVYALCQINFGFDRHAPLHTSPDEIAAHVGASKTTLSQKAKAVRDMFRLSHFDRQFSTAATREANPFNDLVMVDGFIVPIGLLQEERIKALRGRETRR